jgi:hypothetical protein
MSVTPHPVPVSTPPVRRDDLAGLLVEDIPMPDVDELIARTSALLSSGVPLSLLLDLADPTGPHSRDLLSDETANTEWLRDLPHSG